MYMLFKGTFRELSKFVPVGIPEFRSKSGKRPLIEAQTQRFNIKVAWREAPGLFNCLWPTKLSLSILLVFCSPSVTAPWLSFKFCIWYRIIQNEKEIYLIMASSNYTALKTVQFDWGRELSFFPLYHRWGFQSVRIFCKALKPRILTVWLDPSVHINCSVWSWWDGQVGRFQELFPSSR